MEEDSGHIITEINRETWFNNKDSLQYKHLAYFVNTPSFLVIPQKQTLYGQQTSSSLTFYLNGTIDWVIRYQMTPDPTPTPKMVRTREVSGQLHMPQSALKFIRVPMGDFVCFCVYRL